MDKGKLRKLKVHIIFGGGLTLLLLVNVIWRMASGERLLQASWNSLKEIRLMEWVMIFVLWYVIAFPRPQDQWLSNSTLGLSRRR